MPVVRLISFRYSRLERIRVDTTATRAPPRHLVGNSSTVASTHCVIGPNIEAENLNRNIMFGG